MREPARADDTLPAPEVHLPLDSARAEAPQASAASAEKRASARGSEKAKMKVRRKFVGESPRWGGEFEPDII